MMMVSRTLMRMKVHDMAKMKNMRAAVVDCAWPEIYFIVTNCILKTVLKRLCSAAVL